MKKAAVLSILLAVFLLAVATMAHAQQGKIPKIGYLGLIENSEVDSAFRDGLAEHGYIAEQNIRVESRYAAGKVERLTQLAAELVGLKVEVIVTTGTQVTKAAKRATKTVPIIFAVSADPLGDGFVDSLARPGGNITGLSAIQSELTGKRLELIKELIPRLSRVAVLLNPNNSANIPAIKEVEATAKRLAIRVQILEVRSSDDLERVFRDASREQAGALILLPDNLLRSQQGRIRDLASKHRLPVIFWSSEFVYAGGLMSYGANIPDLYRRAAVYVDKILKGARPSDLPVEQPKKFDFIVNLKAAKQIDLTIPPNVLVRADKVIR